MIEQHVEGSETRVRNEGASVARGEFAERLVGAGAGKGGNGQG
jgi:hypothetical protein